MESEKVPSNVPRSQPEERVFAMRRAVATFNLHWREFRQVLDRVSVFQCDSTNLVFRGGWQKFQEAMAESFGENWENEFRSLTGEEPPGKHFYRDIYEEELEKPAGKWFIIGLKNKYGDSLVLNTVVSHRV